MRKLEDSYRHKGLRKNLVKLLEGKGISSRKVLDAINEVPRHFFLDSALDEHAYEDKALAIGEGQTISQPYTVAYQSQLLDVQPKDKVLEIGTGSMYQASVLAALGAKVFTIERHKKLFENTKKFPFAKQYPNVKFFYGDGFLGLPTFGPFDKIIITAAAPHIPEKLVAQLKVGGYMVIPLNEDNAQRMYRITKKEDGSVTKESFEAFSFVPMLAGRAI